MAEHIVCITASGGIPLLSRTKTGCKPLSFPVVGSLNGVHMFGLNRDAKLISTLSSDHRIVWKLYEDSIVLIAVAPTEDTLFGGQKRDNSEQTDVQQLQENVRNTSSTVSDSHLLRLLDNVFHAMVLLTGLNELTNSSNIDHLKKDLRACYRLIDSFLEYESGNMQSFLFGGLTHTVDIMLTNERKILQEHLQAFVEAADSTYGCLVSNGKVICASNKWWMLTGQELALLGRLISLVNSTVTASDIAVYLPHSSPNIPHRLLVFTLLSGSGAATSSGIRVCVLCGPQPSLSHVQNTCVRRFWSPGIGTLQKSIHSEDIPKELQQTLPSTLLAFLLVDLDASKCLSFIAPASGDRLAVDTPSRRKHQQQKKSPKSDPLSTFHKLCNFYKHVVGTSFPLPESIEEFPIASDLSPHTGLAHYRCMSEHKCFALGGSRFQMFALYSNPTPTFAMQSLTEKALDALVKSL